jgi:RsiW-degrading membrane proteinase PrsW (M82 family)
MYAFLGGVIPAIVWLLFWNKEKKDNPEPKRAIILTFLGGMIAVFASLILEKICYSINPDTIFHGVFFQAILTWFKNIATQSNNPLNKILLVIIFAPIIEEILKFITAYILVLRGKDDRDPIDPMIYMITTALGFAAIENMLFLIDPISHGDLITSVLTGNIRFIGAMLLHTVSSATIGIFISFNFFDTWLEKAFWTIVGVISAILIHAFFNFFMVVNSDYFVVLEVIWIVVIIILLAFEKIKRVRLEKI